MKPLNVVGGDLLRQQTGILVHQVNARGVMGAGLARQLRGAYPAVWKDYRESFESGRLSLGTAVFSQVKEGLWVASVVGQDGYGRQGAHTDYEALRSGLRLVRRFSRLAGLPVFVPYLLGCGLAGGDWMRVSEIIGQVLPGCTVLRLPGVGNTAVIAYNAGDDAGKRGREAT